MRNPSGEGGTLLPPRRSSSSATAAPSLEREGQPKGWGSRRDHSTLPASPSRCFRGHSASPPSLYTLSILNTLLKIHESVAENRGGDPSKCLMLTRQQCGLRNVLKPLHIVSPSNVSPGVRTLRRTERGREAQRRTGRCSHREQWRRLTCTCLTKATAQGQLSALRQKVSPKCIDEIHLQPQPHGPYACF